ncbi:hypothetical protein ON021_08230, partial [Microcoleus sp. HI-ES]|nr:hypothetical protein [Microcoleus sp. HI-ES]
AGQNEFLSAVVAAKALEPFLKREQLLQIAGCIEATIPFRAADAGVTVSQRLYDRLQAINSLFNLSLTDEEMRETVKKSVRISNRDVTIVQPIFWQIPGIYCRKPITISSTGVFTRFATTELLC